MTHQWNYRQERQYIWLNRGYPMVEAVKRANADLVRKRTIPPKIAHMVDETKVERYYDAE